MLTKICMEIRVFFRLIYCAITGNVFISTEEEMRKLHVIDDWDKLSQDSKKDGIIITRYTIIIYAGFALYRHLYGKEFNLR